MQILENELLYRLLCFFLGLIVLSIWQKIYPLTQVNHTHVRWRDHFGILLIGHFISRLVLPFSTVLWAIYISDYHFGLLNQFSINPFVKIVLSIGLLDLAIYWQHRIFHQVPLFWRLHRVHHYDTQMDLTTGLRFHPLEIIASIVIKFVVVALIGIDVLSLVLFEILLNLFSLFTHANIKLPVWFEKKVRLFFVTPPMHRIHHSVERAETNSNFGFMLSFWDRLFRSYKIRAKADNLEIELGLREFQQTHHHTLLGMLKNPFL